MLSSVVFVFFSLVATTFCANYTLPSGFDLNQIPSSERHSWCVAERNSCPKICGGVSTSNQCDPDTLNYRCQCPNGSNANVDSYMQTIPYFVCQANFGQCIARHPDDLEGQEKCKDDAKCGTLNASEASSAPTSPATASAISSTAAASATASSRQSATSASSYSATPSEVTYDNAAAMAHAVQDYSVIILTTVLFTAFRLVV